MKTCDWDRREERLTLFGEAPEHDNKVRCGKALVRTDETTETHVFRVRSAVCGLGRW